MAIRLTIKMVMQVACVLMFNLQQDDFPVDTHVGTEFMTLSKQILQTTGFENTDSGTSNPGLTDCKGYWLGTNSC